MPMLNVSRRSQIRRSTLALLTALAMLSYLVSIFILGRRSGTSK